MSIGCAISIIDLQTLTAWDSVPSPRSSCHPLSRAMDFPKQGPFSFLVKQPCGKNLNNNRLNFDEITVTMWDRCVRFEDPGRTMRHVPPSQGSVTQLATDMLAADDCTRAAILLHYSYWPKMVSSVLMEIHSRQTAKRKAERTIFRSLRRKWRRIEQDCAPPVSSTPAVIALPNGTLDGGAAPVPALAPNVGAHGGAAPVPAVAAPVPALAPNVEVEDDVEDDIEVEDEVEDEVVDEVEDEVDDDVEDDVEVEDDVQDDFAAWLSSLSWHPSTAASSSASASGANPSSSTASPSSAAPASSSGFNSSMRLASMMDASEGMDVN